MDRGDSMTRRHGIQSSSYEGLILDAGAIYKDFVSIDSPGTLIGATRGGAVFKRVPSYVDLPYEGIPGQVAGQKHLTGVKATIEVNIISFDEENLALAIPNSSVTENNSYYQITEQAWDASAVHTLNNVAIIAQLSGSSDPIAIVIDNPICENDFTLGLKDKGEAVSEWIFSAFYDESAGFDTPPWRILWPGAQHRIVSIADSEDDIAISDDSGLNWSSVLSALPASLDWIDLKYANGAYIAVAYGTAFAYSTDGENWTASGALPSDESWICAAYAASLDLWAVVAYGNSNAAAYSTDDGATWSAATLPATTYWSGLVYGGKFVAVSWLAGASAYSSDGVNWTAGGTMPLVSYGGVAYGGGTYAAVPGLSSTVAAYSTDDAASWTQATLPFSGNWLCVTYGAGVFVALAQNAGNAAYSADGITWSQSTMPSSQPWNRITYANSVFIATARGSAVMAYSSDGINWTAGAMPQNLTWAGVA